MVFTLGSVLDRAFKDAGIPVVGLLLTDLNDRTTWRAQYAATATPEQIVLGDQLLLTLATDDPATLANLKADAAVSLADMDVIKAVVASLYEAIPAPALTLLQVRNRILARLKT
jgi:pheromone shutdown protein TraB